MNDSHTRKETETLQDVIAKDIHLAPALYLVATPIGNLRDITLRALDVLNAADYVFCEDTRQSRKLLQAYSISKKLDIYHDHSDAIARDRIIDFIKNGKSVALISDAGMPLISDPGYKLVRECQDNKVKVTTVPGPNAPLAAVQLSGLPSDHFSFLGFLPSKQKARHETLLSWREVPSTLVMFETAARLQKALTDIKEVMDERPVTIVREITKLYEEVRQGTAGELIDFYEKKGAPKGEIVIVIGPPREHIWDESFIEEKLKKLLKTHSKKDAAALVAKDTGKSRKGLYDLALKIAKSDD